MTWETFKNVAVAVAGMAGLIALVVLAEMSYSAFRAWEQKRRERLEVVPLLREWLVWHRNGAAPPAELVARTEIALGKLK
jgi:peptidoglycan/LPS O-acetylase OafA/YrhL